MLQQHCISPNFHGKMQCSRLPKSAFLLVFACSHGQIQRRGTRSRQKQSKMTVFCLPLPSKVPRVDLKVDKKKQNDRILSTAAFKKPPHEPQSRQKRSKTTVFCLPLPSKVPRAEPEVDKNRLCPYNGVN